MAAAKIWTIGYEKVGQADFVAALKAAKIETLVDVREVANSRRAGFGKKALTAALVDEGIGYLHLRALGTPKAGRIAARQGMRRIFEAKLAEPESQLALAEVAEMAGKTRVCLMCLEHDWRECHRTIVAQHLAEDFGLEAANLRPSPEVDILRE